LDSACKVKSILFSLFPFPNLDSPLFYYSHALRSYEYFQGNQRSLYDNHVPPFRFLLSLQCLGSSFWVTPGFPDPNLLFSSGAFSIACLFFKFPTPVRSNRVLFPPVVAVLSNPFAPGIFSLQPRSQRFSSTTILVSKPDGIVFSRATLVNKTAFRLSEQFSCVHIPIPSVSLPQCRTGNEPGHSLNVFASSLPP